MNNTLVKQPREWKGVVLPHHSYAIVPMIPVYELDDLSYAHAMLWGNEGNIGIE